MTDLSQTGMAALLTLVFVLVYLLMNRMTYLLFAEDKARAQLGVWRIPERTLLCAAFFGGWIEAKVAQRHLRHKTRKEPFRSQLNVVGLVHVAALVLGAMALPDVSRMAADAANRMMVDGAGTFLEPESPKMPRRFGPGS